MGLAAGGGAELLERIVEGIGDAAVRAGSDGEIEAEADEDTRIDVLVVADALLHGLAIDAGGIGASAGTEIAGRAGQIDDVGTVAAAAVAGFDAAL